MQQHKRNFTYIEQFLVIMVSSQSIIWRLGEFNKGWCLTCRSHRKYKGFMDKNF